MTQPVQAPGELMRALRVATAPAHAQLDGSGLVMSVIRDRRGLAAALVQLLEIHEIFEAATAHFAVWERYGFEFTRRSKIANLRADIARLETDVANEVDAKPALQPHLDRSPADAVGALYVIEGSTLGGRFIAEELQTTLGFRSAYYTSYGADRALMWKGFGRAVEAFATAEPHLRLPVLHGANAMFATFTQTFSNLHARLGRNS